MVFSRFLNVDISTGVFIGMFIVFIYATLGGMKGIAWTQVAQYWVLITAFLVPTIAIGIQLGTHCPLNWHGRNAHSACGVVGQTNFLLNALDGTLTDLDGMPTPRLLKGNGANSMSLQLH